MDEHPEQIEDHIRSTRRELGSNLQELEHRVKDATNWRLQFERHPAALLGIAFAGGILLSAGLGGRRRRPYSGTESPRVASPRIGRTTGDVGSAASDLWGGVKGALIGAATTQIRSLLHEVVPGFREHERNAGRATRSYGLSSVSDHTPVAEAVAAERESEPSTAH